VTFAPDTRLGSVLGWQDYPPNGEAVRALHGRLKLLRDLESSTLGNRRDILVLLPRGYDDGMRHYPVVYFNDGQNLFDPGTSFARTWAADRAADALAAQGHPLIAVGIPNAGARRIDEYTPFRDARLGGGRADDYVDFIADVIKPRVDAAFRTRPDRTDTAIAGSSMGGLVSLHAFVRRNDVFGAAAALSPALWFARRSVFPWMAAQPRRQGRIWLDGGTAEGPLLLADIARLRELLLEKGYRAGAELRFVIDRGGAHDEDSWGRRLPDVLRFMLGAPTPHS
jgi:predicted alpha/beta superfamily hydrolase